MASRLPSPKRDKGPIRDKSLEQYFLEIDQYPLITRKEEGELARRIRTGDQEALEKMVRSNLRFVVTVAKKFQNQGLTLLELISEGNLGLIRAAWKFDETRGVRFISYAVWWIRQAILQALAEQTHVFRIPLNQVDKIRRLKRKSNKLTQELGRKPTKEELSEETETKENEIDLLFSAIRSPLSLNRPVYPGEDDRQLSEAVTDETDGPEEEAYDSIFLEVLSEVLDTLSKREARILELYYGLRGNDPHTLEEIGKIFGITRERVRQIKVRALEKLNHPSRRGTLEPFVK